MDLLDEKQDCWHLYLLETAANTLYTGVTTDVKRRIGEHTAGKGAKYLRAKGPVVLRYTVAIGARGLCLRAEGAIKKLPRSAKEALIAKRPDRETLLRQLGLVDG